MKNLLTQKNFRKVLQLYQTEIYITSSSSHMGTYKCLQPGKLYFFKVKRPDTFPRTSEVFLCRKKFLKFDKIVRNIFRGIFLQRKFSQGNFPGFTEVKHLFTAVNLYF